MVAYFSIQPAHISSHERIPVSRRTSAEEEQKKSASEKEMDSLAADGAYQWFFT
jgi:hypothetical protein